MPDLLTELLAAADRAAARHNEYDVYEIGRVAHEYALACDAIRRACQSRSQVLAALAALDERVVLSDSVTSFMERL
jgi:hypothetical protein